MICIYSERKRIETALLWMLAMFCFCQITMFSAQTAAESSETSGKVIKKVIRCVTGIKEKNISEESFGFLQSPIRKLAHFINFFILGFSYVMLTDAYHRTNVTAAVKIALVCGFISAVIDEMHQYFVPGRSAEFKDVCIDFSGVITGNMFFIILKRVFRC